MPPGHAHSKRAVIFDLDGVLTDTVELHFQGWKIIASHLGIPFDRRVNDGLRGLARARSLEKLLDTRSNLLTPTQKNDILLRKNEDYLKRLESISSKDLLPGVADLLEALRGANLPIGLASSSRNARPVLERLGVGTYFDVIVDANDVPRSKPHPDVYLRAADLLGAAPTNCVAIEDGESGIQSALAAGMRVLGVGPRKRVAGAHRSVASLVGLGVDSLLDV